MRMHSSKSLQVLSKTMNLLQAMLDTAVRDSQGTQSTQSTLASASPGETPWQLGS